MESLLTIPDVKTRSFFKTDQWKNRLGYVVYYGVYKIVVA